MRPISGLRCPRNFSPVSRKSDRVFLRTLAYYEKQRIDLILDERATEINAGAKLVHLAGGGTIPYAQLILAVGARNRHVAGAGSRERAVSAVAR